MSNFLSRMRKIDLPFALTMVLIVGMPLHYYVFELFFSNIKVDNLWRDVLIIVVIALLILRKQFKVRMTGWIVLFNIGAVFAFAMMSKITHNYDSIWNIFRTYTVPTLAYFIGANLLLSEKQYTLSHKVLGITAAIIAVYGLYQAFFLGPDFLVKIGYPSIDGNLSSPSFFISYFYGHQRVTGTLISPNTMGLVFTIILSALLFSKKLFEWQNRSIVAFLILVGLLGTFSRSAILSFIGAVIVYFFYKNWHTTKQSGFKQRFSLRTNDKNKPSLVQRIKAIPHTQRRKQYLIILILAIIFVLIDVLILDSLFFRMFVSSFSGIVMGTDPSANKHFEDLQQPAGDVINSVMSVGFGANGPMAIPLVENARKVESSFILMIYELGVVFAVIFFIPYFLVIIRTLVNKKHKFYTPACISAAVLATYVLLPNVQSFEILFFVFFYIGLYDNESIKKMYVKIQPDAITT